MLTIVMEQLRPGLWRLSYWESVRGWTWVMRAEIFEMCYDEARIQARLAAAAADWYGWTVTIWD